MGIVPNGVRNRRMGKWLRKARPLEPSASSCAGYSNVNRVTMCQEGISAEVEVDSEKVMVYLVTSVSCYVCALPPSAPSPSYTPVVSV